MLTGKINSLVMILSIVFAAQAQENTDEKPSRVPSLCSLALNASGELINSPDFADAYAKNTTVLPAMCPYIEDALVEKIKLKKDKGLQELLNKPLHCVKKKIFEPSETKNLDDKKEKVWVSEFIFNKDSSHIIVCLDNTTLCMWDMQSESLVEYPINNKTRVNKTGTKKADIEDDKTVVVYDLASGSPVRILREKESSKNIYSNIYSIAWSPNDMFIAAQVLGYCNVWDLRSGMIDASFRISEAVHHIAWSDDSSKIAVLGTKKCVVFSLKNSAMQEYPWNQDENIVPEKISFAPDLNKFAFARSADRHNRLGFPHFPWQHIAYVHDLSVGITKQLKLDELIPELSWRPDNRELAVPSWDYRIYLWDGHSNKAQHVMRKHSSLINFVTWNKDGEWLMAGDCAGHLRVWNTKSNKNFILKDEELKIDYSNAQEAEKNRPPIVLSGAWSDDDKLIASIDQAGVVRVWDWQALKQTETLAGLLTMKNRLSDLAEDSKNG